MTVSEKVKTIDNKQAKESSIQLNRGTANILALSSQNVGKYEFLMGEDVLLEKWLTATFKWFGESIR